MDGGPWMEQEHTHTGKMFLPYPHHSILHEHKEPEMTDILLWSKVYLTGHL